MLEIIDLNHVNVVVKDLQRAKRFYCGTLGMTDLPRPADLEVTGAWLRNAMEATPFCGGNSSPVRLRVPSGKRAIKSPASSTCNAARMADRSAAPRCTGNVRIRRRKRLKIGILNSSALAMKRTGRGTTAPMTGGSR